MFLFSGFQNSKNCFGSWLCRYFCIYSPTDSWHQSLSRQLVTDNQIQRMYVMGNGLIQYYTSGKRALNMIKMSPSERNKIIFQGSDIEDTIDYYFSLHSEINLTHKVNTVITPLNIMKLHELFEWRVKKFGNIDHWCNATMHPEWADIRNLNDELREKIIKYLNENESVKNYMNKFDYQRTMNKLLEPSGMNLSLDDILNDTQVKLISKYYNHDVGDLYGQYT